MDRQVLISKLDGLQLLCAADIPGINAESSQDVTDRLDASLIFAPENSITKLEQSLCIAIVISYILSRNRIAKRIVHNIGPQFPRIETEGSQSPPCGPSLRPARVQDPSPDKATVESFLYRFPETVIFAPDPVKSNRSIRNPNLNTFFEITGTGYDTITATIKTTKDTIDLRIGRTEILKLEHKLLSTDKYDCRKRRQTFVVHGCMTLGSVLINENDLSPDTIHAQNLVERYDFVVKSLQIDSSNTGILVFKPSRSSTLLCTAKIPKTPTNNNGKHEPEHIFNASLEFPPNYSVTKIEQSLCISIVISYIHSSKLIAEDLNTGNEEYSDDSCCVT